jgi:hypothetical protein
VHWYVCSLANDWQTAARHLESYEDNTQASAKAGLSRGGQGSPTRHPRIRPDGRTGPTNVRDHGELHGALRV